MWHYYTKCATFSPSMFWWGERRMDGSENFLQLVLNFDFININILDNIHTQSVVGAGSIVLFYFRFISAPIFRTCSLIATIQLFVWFSLCCIVVGSNDFHFEFCHLWSKYIHEHTHIHIRKCVRLQRVNSKTIVKSHRISRFMFAFQFQWQFTQCNGHQRLYR